MNASTELIKIYAKELKLPTLVQYEDVLRQAEDRGYSYEQFLQVLLEREVEQRQQNQQIRRIRAARFPVKKSLDDFDFKQLLHVEEALIWQLATGEFIDKHENIIAIGNPGTGKSHLMIGLGIRLCKLKYRVRFYTAANLATELAEAQADHRLTRFEQSLEKIDLLILDELSYLTFTKPQAELLFHQLSVRNERGSVAITTNLEFSRWGEFFPDSMLTAALVDRLTHHAHILNMNGTSFRLKQRMPKKDTVIDDTKEEMGAR
ncbi:MAG: IS21-like element helper ATPase IstB [Syntrophaceticus sp.]|jgi:DNA replication protein DnaC